MITTIAMTRTRTGQTGSFSVKLTKSWVRLRCAGSADILVRINREKLKRDRIRVAVVAQIGYLQYEGFLEWGERKDRQYAISTSYNFP